jgi:hypothetical protein
MSTHALRKWPRRNFLAELDPELRDSRAIDDLARESVHLRRLHAAVRALSRPIRSRIGRKAWVEFGDARSALQAAEFELAFNLGFENGLIAAQTKLPRRGASEPERQLHQELRRLLAGAALPGNRLLALLLEFSRALALAPLEDLRHKKPSGRESA